MAWQNIGSVHLQAVVETRPEAFRRSIEINPGGRQLHRLGVVERSRATAGRRLRRGRAVDLSLPTDALFNLATGLINNGQAVAARPYVERFVRAAPPAFYAKDIAGCAPGGASDVAQPFGPVRYIGRIFQIVMCPVMGASSVRLSGPAHYVRSIFRCASSNRTKVRPTNANARNPC
jgi:hypothetical protein